MIRRTTRGSSRTASICWTRCSTTSREDGGFAHSYESDPGNPSAIPGESNSIATDQALLALVAVWRQAQGMSILYDFRPGSVSAKILTPEESEVSFA